MNNFIIKKYNYNSFFHHYFNNDEDWMNTYEAPLLDYVKDALPNYVDTIINFGCANGRDFLPFDKEYKCIGFDLASPDEIKWVCSTENLTYYQCSVEDYLTEFDHNVIDLSKSLIYTQGTLMYVAHNKQTEFISHLLLHGCKNIVIHEYPPDQPHSQGYFNPSESTINLFERKHFRKTIQTQPTGFLYLNK